MPVNAMYSNTNFYHLQIKRKKKFHQFAKYTSMPQEQVITTGKKRIPAICKSVIPNESRRQCSGKSEYCVERK